MTVAARAVGVTTLCAAYTSVRLLTRMVPFLHEAADEPIIRDLLWRPGGVPEEAGPWEMGVMQFIDEHLVNPSYSAIEVNVLWMLPAGMGMTIG
ncbi:hypothetical protein AK812_SmicGene30592 [Symbiodinium microadriaticum]|uniref:Uncharacterized protein n=1 Tax=Symbiodinium microadriaticum TaxID=2951 RepID=A0A1Q9CYX4_SYMMI|nr:hypothetical protein AK812_SmicGene30592 [Symbiodinium microadriaticum]